jgi:hypothetical protein
MSDMFETEKLREGFIKAALEAENLRAQLAAAQSRIAELEAFKAQFETAQQEFWEALDVINKPHTDADRTRYHMALAKWQELVFVGKPNKQPSTPAPVSEAPKSKTGGHCVRCGTELISDYDATCYSCYHEA